MIIELNNEQDFVAFQINRSGNTIEILDINVNTERRKGTGSHLIAKLIQSHRRMEPYNLYALTRRSNEAARAFYHSLGFTAVSLLPEFYINKEQDGTVVGREDAIIYSKVVQS